MSDEHNGEKGFEPEDIDPENEHTDDEGFEAEDDEDLESEDDEDFEGEDDVADEGDVESPAPATFAGRRQWSGLPQSGLTEEFDQVEREMAEGLDDEDDHAGEHEIPVGEEPTDDDLEDDLDEEPDEGEDDEGEAEESADDEDGEAEPSSGETVEADTPALADQEEAREAAMAGLKARTAEGQAKRGVSEPDSEEATVVAEQPDAEEQEKSAGPGVTDVVAVAELPANQQKPPKRWLWARFVTASFLIIVSMATATSVSLLVYLTDIAKGLGGLEGLSDQLDAIDEEAQTFLILGSDVRPDEPGHGRSDTTMLLRVDPDQGVISQLSIPRDLKVNIPGHGVDKFNAAYSYGGPKLTLKTIKDLTDNRIPINHVVNVDFNGFADAVDAIGCVYIDVDRDYYVPPGAGYAEIDIDAGYQRLCGLKALQYVRFRHEDNDLVRSARQQGFLREARSQVPPGKLLEQRNKLIDIFTSYTTSDIGDTGTLVTLFKLMLDARNAQINQVHFQTESLGDEEGYVTYSDEGIRASVDQFLGEDGDGNPSDTGSGQKQGDKAKKGGGKDKSKEEPEQEAQAPPVSMIDSTASGQQYAAVLAQDAGDEIKFPIGYPTRLIPNTAISDSDTRWFRIDGPGKEIYRGYKYVMPIGTDNGTEYYGESGTNWLDAPLFKNPSETKEINGRDYKLYYDSDQLRMVAFQKGKAMYWVSNTLDKALDNAQMLELAKFIAVPDG